MYLCNPHPAPCLATKPDRGSLAAAGVRGLQTVGSCSCSCRVWSDNIAGLGLGPTLAEEQEAEQADGEHLHGHAGHWSLAGHIITTVTVVTAGV